MKGKNHEAGDFTSTFSKLLYVKYTRNKPSKKENYKTMAKKLQFTIHHITVAQMSSISA